MCSVLSEYVFISTQLADGLMSEGEPFRKGLGYLQLPPKRVPAGMLLDAEEWRRTQYYEQHEAADMSRAFGALADQLAEWAMTLDGDEDPTEDAQTNARELSYARFVWNLREKGELRADAIFKRPLGAVVFRPRPFLLLGGRLRQGPLIPRQDCAYRPEMSSEGGEQDAAFWKQSLRLQEQISRGVDRMVSDALVDAPATKRAGLPGEIRQEDEILRRVRANGNKGLRGFVQQVLREKAWQFADGHTDAQRCYNRVYALMHPNRRR